MDAHTHAHTHARTHARTLAHVSTPCWHETLLQFRDRRSTSQTEIHRSNLFQCNATDAGPDTGQMAQVSSVCLEPCIDTTQDCTPNSDSSSRPASTQMCANTHDNPCADGLGSTKASSFCSSSIIQLTAPMACSPPPPTPTAAATSPTPAAATVAAAAAASAPASRPPPAAGAAPRPCSGSTATAAVTIP